MQIPKVLPSLQTSTAIELEHLRHRPVPCQFVTWTFSPKPTVRCGRRRPGDRMDFVFKYMLRSLLRSLYLVRSIGSIDTLGGNTLVLTLYAHTHVYSIYIKEHAFLVLICSLLKGHLGMYQFTLSKDVAE